MNDQQGFSAVMLVEQIWSSHVKVVGARRFEELARDPAEVLHRSQTESNEDRGLRFNLAQTIQLLAAALGLTKAAIDMHQRQKRETRISASDLDSLVREEVSKDPSIAPLLASNEYQRLIKALTDRK